MTVTLPEATVTEPAGEFGIAEVHSALLPGRQVDAWLAEHADALRALLLRHGAILFRGFGIDGPERFRAYAKTLCPSLFANYADLPTVGSVAAVYKSTPYPADAVIEFHNEGSHLSTWPTSQFFYCRVPAPDGGETAVADGRAVLRRLPEDLRERLAGGLRYIRHFHDGLDKSWQEFFGTDDADEALRVCRGNGLVAEWRPSGTLRVTRTAPCLKQHRVTGEAIPFHQALLFHPALLDQDTRALLTDLFGADELPRDLRYGDGSAIADEDIARLHEVYQSVAVPVRWQSGDLVMIDNELVAHSRWPFSGPRELFVAMGDMQGDAAVPEAAATAHR
jgi:alpha-ketoglutarate-dependent taurine dioxygenase